MQGAEIMSRCVFAAGVTISWFAQVVRRLRRNPLAPASH
jgi:hypothetical protein